MSTKVFIARLSSYPDDYLKSEYEKIKGNFLSVCGGRIYERKENILGRLILHKALGDLSAGEYRVIYNDLEKPEIECGKQLCFNVSHSGDYVALALSDDAVGCDIQEIKPCNLRVAKRHYSENESRLIENSNDKDECFMWLWTLKESVLKFTGKGISGGLSTYDFSPYEGLETFTAFGCNFYVTKIDNTYFALCHKKTEFEIKKDFINRKENTNGNYQISQK